MLRTQTEIENQEATRLVDDARRVRVALEYLRQTRRTVEIVWKGGRETGRFYESAIQRYVRIMQGGNIGYYATNAAIANIDTVLETVRALNDRDEEAALGFASGGDIPEPKVYDRAVATMDAADLAEVAASIDDYARSKAKDVTCEVSLGTENVAVDLVNTAGFCRGYARTGYSVNIWLKRLHHGKTILNYDKLQSARLVDASPLVDSMLDEIGWSFNEAVLPEDGGGAVILPPSLVSYLVQFVVGMASASLINMRSSCFTPDSIGQKLFDSRITIVDDGICDWQSLSAPFDDEGQPSGRTTLVKNGVLNGFLSDRRHAARLGLEATGNFRYVNHDPTVCFSNVMVSPGDEGFQDLLGSVREATLIGAGMLHGDNLGNFVIVPQASYRVSGGEIVGCIDTSFRLAGNVFAVLNSVSDISSSVKGTRMNMHAPHIACGGLSVI